jgi:rubredoxin
MTQEFGVRVPVDSLCVVLFRWSLKTILKGSKMSEEKVSLSNQQAVPVTPGPGEPGFVLPAATVPLPTLGLLYPPNHPLHGKKTIDIFPMTARHEDILTNKALLKSGKVIDVLLKACLVDKSIDVASMFFGDRNAALISIRITGYGQDYKVEVTCPDCGHRHPYSFDLAKLPLKTLQEESEIKLGVNEFSIDLPVMKRKAVFKMLTGADEQELSANLEAARKVSNSETNVTTRLLHQIISIGGETDRQKIARMVNVLPARDSLTLRRRMSELTPDVEMKQDVKCPSCQATSEMEVPMGMEFFWPSA